MNRISLQEFKKLKPGNKFKAVRCEMDGIRFDSLAEKDFYALMKASKGVVHIDVHPTVTLPGGIRYRPDFIVWRQEGPEAFEIKGVIKTEFRQVRKLFDQFHPLAPLRVYRRTRKGWEVL